MELTNGEVFQVTSARFGAFDPQVSSDGNTLYYSNYTAGGYRICSMDLTPADWKPLEQVMDHREQLSYEKTNKEEEIIDGAAQMDTSVYHSGKYHKALHLFNFHSEHS